MIANDKIAETPAKFDNVIGNNFKVFSGMNVHKGKFLLATYDPTQLQTTIGRPFLVAPLCYSTLQKYSFQKFCLRTR